MAVNLALAYALTGNKVVVIEADMRKPNVAKHFQMSRRVGMSTYLAGVSKLEDVLFAF